MKRLVLPFLLLFVCIFCIGQAPTKIGEMTKRNQLLKLPQSFARDTLLIKAQNEIITIYTQERRLDSARWWINDTEKILKKNNWPLGWGSFYRNRGHYYTFTLQKDSSVADLIHAIQIFEKLGRWRSVGIASARLGNALLMDLKFEKSLQYLQKAMKIFEDQKDYFSQCNTLNYLANTYRGMNNYEMALSQHRRVIQLVETYHINKQLLTPINIAVSYLGVDKIDSAKIWYAKAGVDLDKNPEKIDDMYGYNRLGEYYIKIHNYHKTIEIAKLSQKLAQKTGSTAYLRTAHNLLYHAYKALGKDKDALENFEARKAIEDSLEKAEVSIKLNQLEIQYQSEKKNLLIKQQKAELLAGALSLQNKENKIAIINKDLIIQQELLQKTSLAKQLSEANFQQNLNAQKLKMLQMDEKAKKQQQAQTKYLFIFGISFLGILSALLLYNNKRLKSKNTEITAALLRGQTTERQRVAADLHDNLGSTISSIKYSLQAIDQRRMNANELAVHQNLNELLDKAYNDVRLLSHNLLPEEFEKLGLAETLKSFVRKMNKNSNIKFELAVDVNFGRADKKVEFELYSICLELVNNIIKHSKATEAKISLSRTEKQIELIVSDNGIGTFKNDSDGRGMKNIQARVDAIGGRWIVKAKEGEGVVNEIFIP